MVHWIIQDKVFGDETQELIKYTKSYQLVTGGVYGFSGEGPYIIRGTTRFIKEIYDRWGDYSKMPNLLHLDNYVCSNYYLEIPETSKLNSNFLILPWWKLKHVEKELFNFFNNPFKLFIRPNSGEKLFTGTTVCSKWFQKELDIIESLPSSNFDQQDLVLISAEKKVFNEARFLMHKNEVVSFSSYGDTEFEVPSSYQELVKSNHYYPDMLYTIDVGMTDVGPKIIELNSFVSAGLYDMNYEILVRFVENFVSSC